MGYPFPKNLRQLRQIEWWGSLLLALIVGALILPTRMGNSFACPSAPNAIATHLIVIQNAKQLWMAENKRSETDIPTAAELLPFFNDNLFPESVAGETYQINPMDHPPTAILARPLKTNKGRLPAGAVVIVDSF